MPDIDNLIEELDWISEQVSKRVWTISVATLAFSFSFIIESIGNENKQAFLVPAMVIGPIVLVTLSMVFDLAQYLSGYQQNISMLRRAEKQDLEEINYDRTNFWYRLRSAAYQLKIGFCLAGTLWLVFVISFRMIALI